QKIANCCRETTAFLFSHVGLSAMIVAYTVLGAFTFRQIESESERMEKFHIIKLKDDLVGEILNLTEKARIHPNKKLLNETLRKIFLDFQTELYKAVKDKGWNGLDEVDETSLQWSLAGSILYAITVITTIGYGHVVPKTDIGRIVTILYALVGIPLTFLYLSNIGNFLADCFRIFYKNICCDVFCCKKCERQRKKERLILRKKREKLIRKKLVAEAAKQTVLISCNKKKNRNYAKLRSVVGVTLGRDLSTDLSSSGKEETCEHATVTVPIYICLILIGSYLFIGSALFSFWEGWNTITGSYFCFVTLSTIGFGDIVPGTEAKDWSSQPKLVLCAIWLAFGLSLLAMCFNLMQEEVKEKFK
ncbi:hypothetical protein HELRODRAFT_121515, partial [Helobdella robusta]|uniref:Potassium channel domain-containing protein n=1 Tax=Helobdella robusta TaxID=6412 RepID=T1EGS2_HELRO